MTMPSLAMWLLILILAMRTILWKQAHLRMGPLLIRLRLGAMRPLLITFPVRIHLKKLESERLTLR